MTVKFNSVLIRLFFIAIFISATAMAYISLPDNNIPIPEQTQLPSKEQTTLSTSTVILRPKAEEPLKVNTANKADDKGSFVNTQDDRQTTTTPTQTENFQTAAFSVNEQNYTLQFNVGENLLAAMRRLDETDNNFQFNGREYAGLGFFVDEINGLKTNPSAGKYWIYYVNGEPAKIGISNYLLKSGDIIKWVYKG